MKAIYTAIEDRKIGIFESPTGTGKSKLEQAYKIVCIFWKISPKPIITLLIVSRF